MGQWLTQDSGLWLPWGVAEMKLNKRKSVSRKSRERISKVPVTACLNLGDWYTVSNSSSTTCHMLFILLSRYDTFHKKLNSPPLKRRRRNWKRFDTAWRFWGVARARSGLPGSHLTRAFWTAAPHQALGCAGETQRRTRQTERPQSSQPSEEPTCVCILRREKRQMVSEDEPQKAA